MNIEADAVGWLCPKCLCVTEITYPRLAGRRLDVRPGEMADEPCGFCIYAGDKEALWIKFRKEYDNVEQVRRVVASEAMRSNFYYPRQMRREEEARHLRAGHGCNPWNLQPSEKRARAERWARNKLMQRRSEWLYAIHERGLVPVKDWWE